MSDVKRLDRWQMVESWCGGEPFCTFEPPRADQGDEELWCDAEEVAPLEERIAELEAENGRLVDALEWYADENRYHYGMGDQDESEAEMDEGRLARTTLAELEGE